MPEQVVGGSMRVTLEAAKVRELGVSGESREEGQL